MSSISIRAMDTRWITPKIDEIQENKGPVRDGLLLVSEVQEILKITPGNQ